MVKKGQKGITKMKICRWDPFNVPTVTRTAGLVRFEDLEEGLSCTEERDAAGLSRIVVTDYKNTDLKPRIVITNDKGEETRYYLPVSAYIEVNDGSEVNVGDVLAKIPRESTKTMDITGGLPRVAELFEARKPKDPSIVTDVNGTVSFGKDLKGKRRIVVTDDDGVEHQYLTPKAKAVIVNEGDYVRAGENLVSGSSNPHDILRVHGETFLAAYMVDQIQEVYRLQGVKINDKHIEVIVRQMLCRVKVTEVGDTDFLIDEVVDKHFFEKTNNTIKALGGLPASAESTLLGITKASLSTDSFLSAASFQETTRVLTEAAIRGKVDPLRGCKENVIMGRLIPAGTGFVAYKDLNMSFLEGEDALHSDIL
jgi:DNA-directed RNA polymerase subunit beta'